mgnify:CR=1 FL=1
MITVYSTNTCVWCNAVMKYFKSKGIDAEKVMLDDEPELRQQLLDKTGAMTVPITTDGKDYVVGYNIGKLAKLIGK